MLKILVLAHLGNAYSILQIGVTFKAEENISKCVDEIYWGRDNYDRSDYGQGGSMTETTCILSIILCFVLF